MLKSQLEQRLVSVSSWLVAFCEYFIGTFYMFMTLKMKPHGAGVAGAMKILYLKLVEDQSNTTCEILSP